MNKANIKNFAVWAREKLISDIIYKAGMLGITENGISEKLPQSTSDLHFYNIGTKNYVEVSGKDIMKRSDLVGAIKRKEKDLDNYKEAYNYIVEEVAYTWFNRLIAIRFMEVNDYLPSGIRVLSSENRAKIEPDFVTTPFDTDLEFTPYEQDHIIQLKDENKLDDLFRMLFIKQCNKLHDILPELFAKTDDYTELLLTISFTDKDGIVYRLTHDIDEDDFNIDKEGQVEIIGWMYQYYNIEPKNQVFTNLKKKIKISKEKIPAATQLFTPDWIVRYMVENSLGRLWLEGHSNEDLQDKWEYYLEETNQEQEVIEKLEEMRKEYSNLNPEDIKIIDPCMGSGHILVYAFEVLLQIYESCGWAQREAVQSILKNNLFGIDIDERATQLAYFAVMMKARQSDRRFFNREVKPNIFAIIDSKDIIDVYQDEMDNFHLSEEHQDTLNYVIGQFMDAKEYGSILQLEDRDYIGLLEAWKKTASQATDRFNPTLWYNIVKDSVLKLIEQAIILSQKYDVVVTNPPYMAVSNANANVQKYVKDKFPDSKSDLFAVFIERCSHMIKHNRFQAMITQQSWMFLSSYERLRRKLQTIDIINMIHLGSRAFEEISGEVVQTTSFVLRKKRVKKYQGTYCRLIEPNSEQEKKNMFLCGDNRFVVNQSEFTKISGMPIVYWASEKIVNAFKNSLLYDVSISPSQNVTGNNSKYVRKHWELSDYKINREDNWIFYAKGGGYRKWWGNLENVVNWTPSARKTYQFGDGKHASQIINKEYWYKKGITWGLITSVTPSFRIMPQGATYDKGGSTIIVDESVYDYVLGLLNSKVYLVVVSMLNPTLNFQVKDVLNMPLIISEKNKIDDLVRKNIKLSIADWNSFETSWDFKMHPLLSHGVNLVSTVFEEWAGECNKRFNQLKENEEEINRLFINMYDLQDELTPEIEDKDVTVRKADLQREIKSLLSYAVGCMFGRYSVDAEGIAYAGGVWDNNKYISFLPDKDSCILITDEEYFEDDIVGLFCEWLKVVYGEKTLEVNLDFIAKSLGNKGETSREVIRNYFLNDFIKDHVKIYQKCPIYWMFDSGKQNGFKALCYMHRWSADTIGNMRVEYLHRIQRVYEKEIERMQEVIDNAQDNKEISVARKRKEKLQKQIKETKDYDGVVAHLALARIDIDFDDGVKVNYDKVQTAPDGKKMNILTKI